MAGVTPKFAYSLADAAKAIGIGRSMLYQLINRDELEVIRIGKRVLVPTANIARLLGVSPASLVGSPDSSPEPLASAGPARDTHTTASPMAAATTANDFAATMAAGAAQSMLGDGTFVITIRKLKHGEKVRIEPSRG